MGWAGRAGVRSSNKPAAQDWARGLLPFRGLGSGSEPGPALWLSDGVLQLCGPGAVPSLALRGARRGASRPGVSLRFGQRLTTGIELVRTGGIRLSN